MNPWNQVKKILQTHLGFFLFLFLFALFFSSSVGLMNSIDTPQFFTTESMLRYHSFDMGFFKKDPHYFISPDFAKINGKILNLHGFMLSLVALPLHVISQTIQQLFTATSFNSFVVTNNFLYELSITSLYVLFSVGGLLFVWKSLIMVTKNTFLSTALIILTGVGSSIWKWSACYQRQGMMVFILGLGIYLMTDSFTHRKNEHFWMWSILLIVSFGIDLFLFLSLFLFFGMSAIYFYVINRKITMRYLYRSLMPLLLLALCIIVQVAINIKMYGFLQPFQSIYRDTDNPYYGAFFKGVPEGDRYKVIMSAPLLQTLPVVLFNGGKLPQESYQHITKMTPPVRIRTSYYYLNRYNFFGLFVISSFLLFSIFAYFLNKKMRVITLFSYWVFITNIVLQSVFIVFWGGTQYDVRYFYPYILCLVVPTGIAFSALYKNKHILIRCSAIAFFITMGLFSVFMGWMGVVSMYKPALTGERKMWIDILTFPSRYQAYSFEEYVNATFPNRENAWIAILLSIMMYLIWQIGKQIYFGLFPPKKKNLKS